MPTKPSELLFGDEPEKVPLPVVLQQDLDNAAMRAEIAQRAQEVYDQIQAWADQAFGPGFFPSHRHFLLDHDDETRCRYTSERPTPAATVYTVKNDAGEQRHFTVGPDGEITEHAGYREGFGDMLFEEHATQGFEHKGQFHKIHRYSLNWAPYELYVPKSPEQLAGLRAARERTKDRKWAEAFPLFAAAGMTRTSDAPSSQEDEAGR